MTRLTIAAFSFISSFVAQISPMKASFPFKLAVTPDCKCAMLVEPVCGRLGNTQYTYMNECVLECSKKQANYRLELIYRGSCCRQTRCSPFDMPVCDHNGKMYDSSCSFETAQCVDLRRHGRHLAMDSSSSRCSCVQPCPQKWKPVCDSKGKTHANHCSFLNHKCLFQQQYNETISVDYEGTCCDDMCFSGHSTFAICDTNGQTHADLCSFYKAQCQQARRSGNRPGLKVSSLGACKEARPNITNTFQYFVQRFAE